MPHIRSATPADAVWMSLLLSTEFEILHRPGIDPRDMELLIERNFDPEPLAADIARTDRRYLVAVDADQPLGVVRIGPPTLELATAEEGAGELSRFYLLPAARRQGLGQQLMQAVHSAAHDLGYRSIWIHVYKENPRALAFYERLGFVHRGTAWLELPHSRPEGWVLRREV